MIASELISDSVPSIKSSDTLGRALDWMNEFKLPQLPIVDGGMYAGMITEDEIMEASDLADTVGKVKRTGWESAAVYEGKHLLEVIRIMSSIPLEVLPVLDEENSYLGAITLRDLAAHLGKLFAIHEPGGVVVIKIPANGYSLSEIGRIVESADAKVLSLYLSTLPNNQGYIVTLKINLTDPSPVVASFERFEYAVVQTFYHAEKIDSYRKNIDALMNYLNI